MNVNDKIATELKNARVKAIRDWETKTSESIELWLLTAGKNPQIVVYGQNSEGDTKYLGTCTIVDAMSTNNGLAEFLLRGVDDPRYAYVITARDIWSVGVGFWCICTNLEV